MTFNQIVMEYTDMLNQTETITIENVTFSIVQVKDIIDRLPENCWLAEKSDEFEDNTIFFHEGDVELSIWGISLLVMPQLVESLRQAMTQQWD